MRMTLVVEQEGLDLRPGDVGPGPGLGMEGRKLPVFIELRMGASAHSSQEC